MTHPGDPVPTDDLVRARDLMAKYRALPMDLAAAALVAIAERLGCRRIFTLDRSDSRIYRPKGLKTFEVFP